MRIVPIAFVASIAVLAACGAASTSQANNAQATMNNTAVPVATSAASLVTARVTGRAAAQIMHERHEGMESIGKAFKALHREFDSASPFAPTVRTSAAQIATLSKKASGWFPAGTGPEVGKTGAKPEIWKTPQDFAAKLGAFQKAALVFNAAASGNDMNAAKARYADLGGACKACHDKYRSEMHH
jgi:cytochrome c556